MIETNPSHSDIFQRPLIIGASVSADWAAHSPGKRLSSRFTRESDIRVIAKNGRSASQTFSLVTPDLLQDRSVVIGIDLFFWDSVRGSEQRCRPGFESLVQETESLGQLLIVGDVPELLAGYQPHREKINEMIREIARNHRHVRVIPLENLYVKMLETHSLEIRGQTYSFLDLLPDGLHIGEVASDFLADLILSTIG